jgi:hypothetical protein
VHAAFIKCRSTAGNSPSLMWFCICQRNKMLVQVMKQQEHVLEWPTHMLLELVQLQIAFPC